MLMIQLRSACLALWTGRYG